MDGRTTPDGPRRLTRREFLIKGGVGGGAAALFFLTGCWSENQTVWPAILPLEQRQERLMRLGLEPFWDFYREADRFANTVPGWKMHIFPELLAELDQVARGEITNPNDPRLRVTPERKWGNRINECQEDARKNVERMQLWTEPGSQSAQNLSTIQSWLRARAEYVPKLVLANPGRVRTNLNPRGQAGFAPLGSKAESGLVFNNLNSPEAAIVGWLHEIVHAFEYYCPSSELSPYYSRQDAGRYMAARARAITDSLVALAKADGKQAEIFKEGRPLIPAGNIPKIFRETPGFVESIMEKSARWLGTPVLKDGGLHEKYNFLTQALVSYWVANKETVPVDMLSSDWLGTYVRGIIWSAIVELEHYHVGPIQNEGGGLISGRDRVAMPDSELARISIELEKIRRETVWGISGADRWQQVRQNLGVKNPTQCIIDVENFCVNVAGIDPPTAEDFKIMGVVGGAISLLAGAGLYFGDQQTRRKVNQILLGKDQRKNEH